MFKVESQKSQVASRCKVSAEKNLLIVTDAFPPAFAPRMGALSCNLEKMGWDVTIVAEENKDVHYSMPHLPKKVYKYNYQSNLSAAQYYYKTFLNLITAHKTHFFWKKCYKEIKNDKFDLVLCSTFNEFPLNLSYKIAKKWNIPLVCDIRDLVEQFGPNFYSRNQLAHNALNRFFAQLIRKKRINARNKIIKKADAITTVSPWHQEYIRHLNNNVHLIYNGYANDMFCPAAIKSETFDIIYAGRLLDPQTQNPILLFQAIEELRLEKIRLVWYVDAISKKIIEKLLADYPTAKGISAIHSLVEAEQVPTLLNQSSIVLVLTNKADNNGPKGIMTTKFFEAIGVEKPVLCVRSDQGCLAQLIEETNAGIAATTVKEVKSFIELKYKEWQEKGFTRQPILARHQFSRENQAKQFVEIFDTLLK